MLEDFKLSHLQFAFLGLVAAVIVGGVFFYGNIISQASELARDSYECDSVGPLTTIEQDITNQTDAEQYVASYLSERNISLQAEDLTSFEQEDRIRVSVPEAVYSGRTCTWRNNGTAPPQCLGKWFDIKGRNLLMQYEVPCP